MPTRQMKTADAYKAQRIKHWDSVADVRIRVKDLSGYYHNRLEQIFGFLVPVGSRVLELGSGSGDLLASLRPSYGVGVDFSPRAVKHAQERYPDLTFVEGDAHSVELEDTFDVIIMSDLVNDLWDVQGVLQNVRRFCHGGTRLILNSYSRIWQLPLGLARRLGMAKPELQQNWFTVEDLENLLSLSDFEVVKQFAEVLWPMRTPLVGSFLNRILVKVWPFKYFAMTNFVVVRPRQLESDEDPNVSVIIPARNEAGHINSIVERTPEMGRSTELIFVEGKSSDDTYETIEAAIADNPQRNLRVLKQLGQGKGDAVRLGFGEATGDVLMILDADMTVPPEDLPRFLSALVSGDGEFINGVRLVYPMEDKAMRFLNLVGNKFFSFTFSWLLQQRVKDTLCGTKVLYRRDYERIAANRDYFGDFDPFGDFDLLFGAAKLNLRIVDMPIRYGERVYGDTNINRWQHGWLLIRMAIFAARRLRFT